MKENTIQLFREIFKNLEPPPDVTLSEWADNYRRLSKEANANGGKWRTSDAPYQKEIMESITDSTTQKTIVMSCSQIGKTDACLLNPIGYYMHYDPSPIMVLQPTVVMGEAFSKDRLAPMLRDTPVLKEKVSDKRNSGNTIMQKTFPGGHVTIVNSNSPQSLASRPIRILLADEIDRYPASAGKEGDPLLLAARRQEAFWNRKEVDVSTPTIKGISRIEVEYEHSTQGEWNVPCPCCGEYQPLIWENVIYDVESTEKIEYVCEKCGVISVESRWREQFQKGKYIHKYPKRKVKGFHMNALASTLPGASWQKIVDDYLVAEAEAKKGNTEMLKVWWNTSLGLPWEELGEQLDKDELAKRREVYNAEVPDDVICLTAGVDTQDDRFEIEIVGWGVEKESWGIRYSRIYGDLKKEQIWKDLDNYLDQEFTKADGTKYKIMCTCIDSGGHFTNEVYKFCKTRLHRHIYPIKGSNQPGAAYIPLPSKNNRYKTPFFNIGVDTGKSLLYDRLKVTEQGGGYCHFPCEMQNGKMTDTRGYDDFYFKGLTAEKQVIEYKKGKAFYTWVLRDPSFKRNEPLDIRNYATAALEIRNPVLKKEDEKPKTKKQQGRKRRGGVNSG